ncbi:hypothetical protein CRYUN_Cryun28dG0015300 [Craigia yunnanensis]
MENFPALVYRNPKRSSRQSSRYLRVRRRPWGSDIERARTNFYYPFLVLPSPPVPSTPPPPPPTPELEASDQNFIKEMNNISDEDDESLVIACILQTFAQSANCSFYP